MEVTRLKILQPLNFGITNPEERRRFVTIAHSDLQSECKGAQGFVIRLRKIKQ